MVIKMNKKIFIIFAAIALLVAVFIGGTMLGQGESTEEEYDTAYYVEDTNNVFIKLGKFLDKCCFYIVDVVVGGISTIFLNLIG